MALYIKKNFSFGYIASTLSAGATTLSVSSGHSLPTTAGSFRAVVWDSTNYPSPSVDPNVEIVTATYSTTNTYTVVRGQESTTDRTHVAGKKVSLTYTAGVADADLYIIGSKEVDESAISNGRIPQYNSSTDKIEWVVLPGGGDMNTSVYDPNTDGLIDASILSYHDATYTTVEAALDHLLYVPLTGSMTNTTGTVEIGSTVSSVTLNWSYNKTVTSQSIDNGIGSVSPVSLRTVTQGSLSLTSNRTYTLTASDGTTTITPTSTVYFSHKRYWGAHASASATDAQIIGLTSEFSSTRVKSTFSVTCAAQYIYYCYPASWGAATFTVNGLLNTDWTLTTANFTNASGNTTSFRKYRTNNLLTGTYNISVS